MPCPFVQTKYFLSGTKSDKNFVHGLKIIFSLGKLVSSHGQNFCPGQKIFCCGQNYFVLDKSNFVPDKKCFVWADGQGIRQKEILVFFFQKKSLSLTENLLLTNPNYIGLAVKGW